MEHTAIVVSGAFYDAGTTSSAASGATATGGKLGFDASRSNNKYTSTNEVRPLTLRTNVIIKY